MQLGEILTISLDEELRRERYRVMVIQQEVRNERDAVDRHETESRLLMIKVRNLEGVASTAQAVVN